jgi:prolyl-tRNA editing enzyme YbaK/EbsC (Cys-tRNA(Pro) deacylase)
VGHKIPCPIYIDETLLEYDEIWVAAGTPNYVFRISPDLLSQKISAQISDFII